MSEKEVLTKRFTNAFEELPLVAILRGIRPEESEEIALSLFDAGLRLIEIPLNSPDPFKSIALIRKTLPVNVIVGAGTVLKEEDVSKLKDSGGEMVFMPHSDLSIVRAAKASGLQCIPGVATPTEAFAALNAGADALKLFPGEMITPKVLKAIRVVLPKEVRLLPFGGITTETMKPYHEAGARAFGLGSSLYTPGMTSQEIAVRAKGFVKAWQELNQQA